MRLCPRTDSLEDRAEFANNLKADLFLSIHVNAGGGSGFESYIYREAGDETRRIRDVIHDAVVSGFLIGQGVRDRGKKEAGFAVLRLTNMPAVLLECLFIDNAADSEKLKKAAFLDGLANEIAWGVVLALGLQRKEQDPCKNCKTLADLQAERDKLYAENQTMRQVLRQVAEITAPYVNYPWLKPEACNSLTGLQ